MVTDTPLRIDDTGELLLRSEYLVRLVQFYGAHHVIRGRSFLRKVEMGVTEDESAYSPKGMCRSDDTQYSLEASI